MTTENYKAVIEMKDKIVAYLESEKKICEEALKAYDPQPVGETNDEIRVMREKEAIKLRDRAIELSRHISVIKAMYPNP